MRKYAFAAAILLVAMGSALADDYPFIGEALPPHLENRIQEQDASLQLASISLPDEYFISTVKLWDTRDPITVCFFDGSKALRAKIAKVAMTWTTQGAYVPLDFGNLDDPRICSSAQRSRIRVGFAYSGYWSLVGTDSERAASQREQSMNFALFDVNPPPDQQFTQIVLHEFGHALGYQHEHQSYLANCEAEFDWPRIYTLLAGSPNFWPRDKVDHNLRPRHAAGDAAGPFDPESIMLYHFPASFLLGGTGAACYTPGNFTLSAGDIAGLRKYYPATANELADIRAETLAVYQTEVDALPVSAVERNIAKLQASTLLQPESLVQFSPQGFETPRNFQDLMVFQNLPSQQF